MRAKAWVGVLVAVGSLVAVAFLAEWVLGKLDYRPTPVVGNDHFNMKAQHGWAQLDPATGWKNREGSAVSMEPGNVRMTFWSHGRRATRSSEAAPVGPLAVVLGDSITQGYGVVDSETFSYMVQQWTPAWRIENFGTGGYGGYQSLLTLRKIYADGLFRPALVVYAFAGFHTNRDVANYSWVEAFISSIGEYFAPPSVTVSSGRLVEHPLIIYKAWPYEHESRLISLFKKGYLKSIYGGRTKYENDVSKLLIGEMQRTCERNGAKFLVLKLTRGSTAVEQYLHDARLAIADCLEFDPKLDLTAPEAKVGGVGHPSALVHTSWAGCLSSWMSRNQ